MKKEIYTYYSVAVFSKSEWSSSRWWTTKGWGTYHNKPLHQFAFLDKKNQL